MILVVVFSCVGCVDSNNDDINSSPPCSNFAEARGESESSRVSTAWLIDKGFTLEERRGFTTYERHLYVEDEPIENVTVSEWAKAIQRISPTELTIGLGAGADIDEEFYRAVAKLDDIKKIFLIGRGELSEVALRYISQSKTITHIYIEEGVISELGFSHLAKMDSLTSLDIEYRHLSVSMILSLRECKGLKNIRIVGMHLKPDEKKSITDLWPLAIFE